MKLGEGCASPRQGSSSNCAQLECKHYDYIEKNKTEGERGREKKESSGKVRRGKMYRGLKVNAAVLIVTGPFFTYSLLLSNINAIITAG